MVFAAISVWYLALKASKKTTVATSAHNKIGSTITSSTEADPEVPLLARRLSKAKRVRSWNTVSL